MTGVVKGNALILGTGLLGLTAYNYFQQPTSQTVQGVDNTTIMWIAAAVVAAAYFSRG